MNNSSTASGGSPDAARSVPNKGTRAKSYKYRQAEEASASPSPHGDPIKLFTRELGGVVEAVNYFSSTYQDLLRHQVRQLFRKVLVGLAAGLVVLTVLITAAVHLVSGLAGGLSWLFSINEGAGSLAAGLLILVFAFGGIFYKLRSIRSLSFTKTKEQHARERAKLLHAPSFPGQHVESLPSSFPQDSHSINEADFLQEERKWCQKIIKRNLNRLRISGYYLLDATAWTKYHPWEAVGVSAAGGFSLARILSRKMRKETRRRETRELGERAENRRKETSQEKPISLKPLLAALIEQGIDIAGMALKGTMLAKTVHTSNGDRSENSIP